MPLNFHVALSEADEDILVLGLEGDLDLDAAEAFEKLLGDLIAQGRTRLVADCASLAYMSSRGAGEIFHALKAARDAGGDLKLSGLSGKARVVFDMLGLEALIELLPSREHAIRAFDGDEAADDPGGLIDEDVTTFATSVDDERFHEPDCSRAPDEEDTVWVSDREVADLLGKNPCRRCVRREKS